MCKQQQQQQKYIKKSIQDQVEQTKKSSRLCQLQYRMEATATYTRVSLYLLCLHYFTY